jgi:DNA (cytosine-5)-methyltransferase 1
VVVLENVMGLVTRKGGRDLATVADALVGLGYEAGALVVDSSHFVPQSRPRVFVVACAPGLGPASLRAEGPRRPWHPPSIVKAVKGLSQRAAQGWVWWDPGAPPARTASLADLLEPDAAVAWYDDAETRRLVGMMAPLHRTKVDEAAAAGFDSVGGLFVRTRVEAGGKAQRAEVRFDGVAGCLRTAQGGSSRQRLLVAGKGRVRARLLSPREGARLMGLPDSYVLPEGYTNAFHLLGDGVCAAVVAFLRDAIVEPVLESAEHGALVA